MLEDNNYYLRVPALKAIAKLVKYRMFPDRTAWLYSNGFADDFREPLCEYMFMTSMVGMIMQLFYCEEQCILLDVVGELAKYGTTS